LHRLRDNESGCEADDRVLGEAWWSEEASA
jgi:hypothetical protein